MDPRVDWLMVFTKLASGVWTMEQAAAYTGMSVAALEAQILAARTLGGRLADLAVRIITRYGLGAAAGAVAGTTAAATAIRVGLALLGVGLLAGTLLLGGYAAYQFYNSTSGGTSATQPKKCPSPVPVVREKCPWTPEGYSVEPCTQGFCWDGGPQGALACKQKDTVPNSGRTYTSDLVCSEGYTAERDPCTNVIIRCVKQ